LTGCVTHSTVRHMADQDAFAKLELELRRGVLVLATLSQLRTPRYGYELRQALVDKGMPIEEGTLYPLLRRLEAQGVLASEWKIEDGPPRRYYALNADGRTLLDKLTGSWQGMNAAMDQLLKED
jgi:PadR family transcriptional regulator, regulatory protein PadR